MKGKRTLCVAIGLATVPLALPAWAQQADAPAATPVASGLTELTDQEMGDMRGRYTVSSDSVAWFGITMVSIALAIGASTGGIHALGVLFQGLPERIGVPILVTQHLPQAFMPVFARQLGAIAHRECLVAEDGMELLPDRILLAPGDAHRTLETRWSEVVGADVAPHARLVSVREGSLTVAVDEPVWATQLRYLESAIVTRATALLGPVSPVNTTDPAGVSNR